MTFLSGDDADIYQKVLFFDPHRLAITPDRNPKSYQPPLLCTSYMCTESENNEIRNVTPQTRPCQIPKPKPATLPVAGNVLATLFGPAVCPTVSTITMHTRYIATSSRYAVSTLFTFCVALDIKFL